MRQPRVRRPGGFVAVAKDFLPQVGGQRKSRRNFVLGRQLRAVGSNPLASLRLGVDVGGVVRIAFALAGAFSGIAGLMLAGQIGIGSGTTGVDFSLMSITAVVLAGVSVAGGRGSAVSVLFGAALVQATTSASSFLNTDSSWQYTVVGAITLIGACLFSIARRSGGRPKLAH